MRSDPESIRIHLVDGAMVRVRDPDSPFADDGVPVGRPTERAGDRNVDHRVVGDPNVAPASGGFMTRQIRSPTAMVPKRGIVASMRAWEVGLRTMRYGVASRVRTSAALRRFSPNRMPFTPPVLASWPYSTIASSLARVHQPTVTDAQGNAIASPESYSGGLIRRTVRPDSQREPLPKRMVESSCISTLYFPRTEFVRGSIWTRG